MSLLLLFAQAAPSGNVQPPLISNLGVVFGPLVTPTPQTVVAQKITESTTVFAPFVGNVLSLHEQLTQMVVEVVGSSTTLNRQLTQDVVEVVGNRDETSTQRRLSQMVIEVVVYDDMGYWDIGMDATTNDD